MGGGLGFTDEEIGADLEQVSKGTSRFVKALDDMGIDAVSLEENMAASIDGHNIRGRADIIGRRRGTNEEVIIDTKTGNVGDGAVVQTGAYAAIRNQLRREAID